MADDQSTAAETDKPRRPYPIPDGDSAFYWEAARKQSLEIARCQDCKFFIHPPRGVCPRCWSDDVKPQQVTGRGTVYSYAVCHLRDRVPGFDEVPYVTVMVELEEQRNLRMLTNLLDCPVDDVHIGMPVVVAFEVISDEITLPQFRPAKGETR